MRRSTQRRWKTHLIINCLHTLIRMKIFVYIIIMLTVIQIQSCRSANDTTQSRTVSPCGIKLFYTLGGVGAVVKNEFDQAGFHKIALLNQRRIAKKGNPWLVDETVLADNVKKYIPDSSSSEFVVLNWEGPAYLALQKGPSHADFNRAAEEFIKAIELVKELRPNCKVGYYGFPVRNYWKRSDNWRQRNRSLDDFLSHFDVLFPSVYDFYDSDAFIGRDDLGYVRDNVEEAINSGIRLGVPVMPFVHHRYHPSNGELGRKIIPPQEFESHVAAAAQTNVGGRRIDGVVWWSSEYSWYHKANRKLYGTTKEMRRDWEIKSAEVLPTYYRTLHQAVSSVCQ